MIAVLVSTEQNLSQSVKHRTSSSFRNLIHRGKFNGSYSFVSLMRFVVYKRIQILLLKFSIHTDTTNHEIAIPNLTSCLLRPINESCCALAETVALQRQLHIITVYY